MQKDSPSPPQRYERVRLPWQPREGGDESDRPGRARVLLLSPAYNAHIVAPHLGLGYLAAALKRSGHHVDVIDGLREPIRFDGEYDVVGVSAMTTYFPEAVREVRRAKKLGYRVIVGGPHVIADPEGSLEQSGADYACSGEGELVLGELINGTPPAEIPGLIWRDGTTTRRNPAPVFYPDIDDFGEPDWDAIDPRTYPPAPHGMIARAFPLAPIITTRGCPYRCSYCSAPITAGRRMRYRAPTRVVDEIQRLVDDYGVKEIQIEDDNFTLKRDHVLAICDEILARGIRVHWSLRNGVRIDRLDNEMLAMMKRSGCYLMALGIESANQRILDMVSKRLDLNIVREQVGHVVDAGIQAWGFFMIGFPTETREEIANTVEYALSLPLHRVQFTKTTPLPGTPIYEWWKTEWGKGRDIDWSSFNYYNFASDWSEVSSQELNAIQKRAHLRYYSRPRNFLRVVRSIRLRQYPYILRRIANLGAFRTEEVPKVDYHTA
jgi:radical SAM superfamily enzyme YgiQ (UPF0313 family)